MMLAISRLTAVLLTGLLAGSGLAISLLEANLGGSSSFYTEYKQLVIRAYTIPLPVLGGGSILASVAIAFLGRRYGMTLWLALAAALLVATGLVITLLVHFPINAQIMTWSPQSPPADWRQLADRWREANLIRSAAAIIAFVLLLVPLGGGRRTAGRFLGT
jgi:uncharacterized membrane protein